MEISGGIGYIGPKLPDITNFFVFSLRILFSQPGAESAQVG